MSYEVMMKNLLGAMHESLPMVGESYDHLAREFDIEISKYFGDEVDSGKASSHVLYHRECLYETQRTTRELRGKEHMEHPYMVECSQVIAVVEDHCVQLAHPSEHGLPPVQAATNRAVWQGANALLSMAIALRPNSRQWMSPENTWRKGVASAIVCIAILRTRRDSPEELLFNSPESADSLHPLVFASRMLEHVPLTQRHITELFSYKPAVPAGG